MVLPRQSLIQQGLDLGMCILPARRNQPSEAIENHFTEFWMPKAQI
jgi:hypothetical protein